ncbi:MAG: hypothetical protein IPN87_13780 [Saprospiraceae bacterium]|nr:hypothetical protein [Candidatus Brachybacter algidus]
MITGAAIDKNDFSFNLHDEPWKADVVFCAIHGAPMENGVIQGYFDILDIPYTCCDSFVSALTMSKYLTKQVFERSWRTHGKEVFLNKKSMKGY